MNDGHDETHTPDALRRCVRCGCAAARGKCAHCFAGTPSLCPVFSRARLAWIERVEALRDAADEELRLAARWDWFGVASLLLSGAAPCALVWSGHEALARRLVVPLAVGMATASLWLADRHRDRAARKAERAERMLRRGWASETDARSLAPLTPPETP